MPHANAQIEKRSHPRVPIQLPVKFRLLENPNQPKTVSEIRKGELKSKAIDASLGGMFIASEEDLTVGSIMSIHFSLPDKATASSAFAEVVWTNETGGGVHFIALKPEDLESLAEVLNRAGEARA